MRPAPAYTIALAIFVLDRATKWLVETRMSTLDAYTVIPGFFDIVHARNPGAAFSLFADADGPWRTFLLIGVALAVLVMVALMLRKAHTLSRSHAWGLALILGGALGNVYDRALTGAVTDFLDFYIGSWHWPAFNVADSAIVTGAGLLILDILRNRHKERA